MLDLDWTRANNFPADYETDLDLAWSNPSESHPPLLSFLHAMPLDLFADGTDFSPSTKEKNRNRFYQQQLVTRIQQQAAEVMSLVTKTLQIHLNRGQNLVMNTSSAFISVESISPSSLFEKVIRPVGNTYMRLPSNVILAIDNSTTIAIRVRHFLQSLRCRQLLWFSSSPSCSHWRCPMTFDRRRIRISRDPFLCPSSMAVATRRRWGRQPVNRSN